MKTNLAVVPFPQRREPADKGQAKRITNAKSISGLPVPKTGVAEYPVADKRWRGLRLRITSNGIKTWSFRYANPQGAMQRLNLGRYPDLSLADACDKAEALRRQLADGVDPKEVKAERREAITFGELAHKWVTDHAEPNTKGQGIEEMNAIRRELSTWFPRVADDIKKIDVIDFHTRITKRGHKPMANRLRGHISAIYNWGKANEYVTTNPVEFTIPNDEGGGRERVLTQDEIRRVWAACDLLPLHKRVWFRLRLVTGQRASELLQMRWDDVDPETHWWTIPAEFIKNGLGHTVYRNELARELLAELPKLDPVWVFPNGPQPKPEGGMTDGANTSALDVMQNDGAVAEWLCHPSRANIWTAREKTNVDTSKWTATKKSGITGHDLRRTMTTLLATKGVDDKFLSKILNHMRKPRKSGRDATKIYQRYAHHKEKKRIAEYWAVTLRAVLAGENIEALPDFVSDDKLARLLQGILVLQDALQPELEKLSPTARGAWAAFLKATRAA